MKRVYIILFVILLMSFIPDTITAGNHSSYTTTVYKTRKQSEHNQHLDCEGRRMPPSPLCCFISQATGLSIDGLSENIINYSVWDAESETYIASFSEELDFLDFILNQTGDFQLKFETENYHVFGYISLD